MLNKTDLLTFLNLDKKSSLGMTLGILKIEYFTFLQIKVKEM